MSTLLRIKCTPNLLSKYYVSHLNWTPLYPISKLVFAHAQEIAWVKCTGEFRHSISFLLKGRKGHIKLFILARPQDKDGAKAWDACTKSLQSLLDCAPDKQGMVELDNIFEGEGLCI